jgi:hypothetical protein
LQHPTVAAVQLGDINILRRICYFYVREDTEPCMLKSFPEIKGKGRAIPVTGREGP